MSRRLPSVPRDRIALRVKFLLLAVLLLSVVSGANAESTAPAQACPPQGWTMTSLQALKARSFVVADKRERMVLAEGLLVCLSDPAPALRDGIAYEALSHWMRAGDFENEALRDLRGRLYAMLDSDDPQGFGRPFAALVLAEVARTDRVQAWMSPWERNDMVARAAGYLISIDDYRGYDNGEGWRHGIAHGADWLMQLSLNPALERAQLDGILAAVAAQAVPARAHAYVFGEPERLARPVLFIAQRGVYSEQDWQDWFGALPTAVGDASDADADQAWMARRHDLHSFLQDIYLEADQSEDAGIGALKPAVVAALKQLP